MKSSDFRSIIFAFLIIGSATSQASAQNIDIQRSVNNGFTFSDCVSDICVNQIRVFQENVREYIPSQMQWAGGGSSGVSSFGGTTIPAHWETYDRARIVANVAFPSCSNQYHLVGYLTVKYHNGGAYITRTHEIQRSDEGQAEDLDWVVTGYYGEPSNGSVDIEGNTHCEYHGVDNRGGPSWAPWNW